MPQILRTPDKNFENLPDYNFKPHYVEVDGLRMHYVDEGTSDEIVLCLHGEPSWSFLYRKMIPIMADAGYRVIAPDLIGFGKSDKLAEKEDYSFELHAKSVNGFIEALDLKNITIVVQDWGGILGFNAIAELTDRFSRLVIMNTGLPTGEKLPRAFQAWLKISQKMDDMPVGQIISQGTSTELPQDVIDAYDAPYPSADYKAGAHIFPSLVPQDPELPAAKAMQAARDVLSSWEKPALVMFSDGDPITRGADDFFRELIPTAANQPKITIENGGHFLQEDQGEVIAKHIVDFMQQ